MENSIGGSNIIDKNRKTWIRSIYNEKNIEYIMI